jgi:hypothetical protein
MNPLNKEHIEAEQAITNKRKEALIEMLPAKERERLMIIEECCKKMEDAGILFFLFPSLNSKERAPFWQYNSMGKTATVDEGGRLDRDELAENNRNFIYSVLYMLYNGARDKQSLIFMLRDVFHKIQIEDESDNNNKTK